MKRGTIWIALICFIVTSLVLASCTKTTASTTTSTSVTTNTSTTKTTSSTTVLSTSTTSTTTTTATGNWWDKLGTPQYGGQINIRINQNILNSDPYNGATNQAVNSGYMEQLTADDWTLNPSVFSYQFNFRPSDYVKGFLAKSWEFTDSNTYVVHLRQGIRWQNLPPVNGREFTSDDVVYHYDRLFGLGNGFTKAAPYFASLATWQDLKSVTATDKYTVAFFWKTPNPELITETMQSLGIQHSIEAREAVQLWGDLNDWHHAIGTGPFILQDFVSDSSATLVKNPNYWGYDERYPKNQLPYVDAIRILIIPNSATALAGLRSGKIDVMDSVSLTDARSLKNTNPEILQIGNPLGTTLTVDPRDDVKPFNDIRVREAMQMAINLPELASSYYGGAADPFPASITSNDMTGWGFPYNEWPQDLKDQYAYNPTTAKKLLADAGYPTGFKTNIVASSDCDMDLIQVVKSYFSQIGIDMDIRVMEPVAWSTYVLTGHKQDQMSVRNQGSYGLSFQPSMQLQRYQTGWRTNLAMVSDPVYDALYAKALASTSIDNFKQLLRDANEYVVRQHWSISLVEPRVFYLSQPWLKGFTGQNSAVTNAGQIPLYLFQYGARFWIDQNLKKSMGH